MIRDMLPLWGRRLLVWVLIVAGVLAFRAVAYDELTPTTARSSEIWFRTE